MGLGVKPRHPLMLWYHWATFSIQSSRLKFNSEHDLVSSSLTQTNKDVGHAKSFLTKRPLVMANLMTEWWWKREGKIKFWLQEPHPGCPWPKEAPEEWLGRCPGLSILLRFCSSSQEMIIKSFAVTVMLILIVWCVTQAAPWSIPGTFDLTRLGPRHRRKQVQVS